MDNFDENSRVNKFEKRRKNTNVITILMIVGVLLLITLFVIWLVGGEKEEDNSPEPSTSTSEENNNNETINQNKNAANENDEMKQNENQTDDNVTMNNDEENDEENDSKTSKNEKVEIKEIESAADDNIISTYTANWQPIGTKQSEPHDTPFLKNTVDWEEMKQAIGLAARLDPDDMITWFIGNDGEQKAVGTVSPSDNSETYRVYISWITGEGWKPTQVEILKENEYDN